MSFKLQHQQIGATPFTTNTTHQLILIAIMQTSWFKLQALHFLSDSVNMKVWVTLRIAGTKFLSCTHAKCNYSAYESFNLTSILLTFSIDLIHCLEVFQVCQPAGWNNPKGSSLSNHQLQKVKIAEERGRKIHTKLLS